MRVAVFLSFGLLCACAGQKLAVAPSAAVDFTGRWHLNESESDDPMRLASSPLADPSRVGDAEQQGQGGRGRGRGRGGGGGAGGGGFDGSWGGPAMPGVGALRDGMRWPGKDVEIKQVAGVVSLSSGGIDEVYVPRSIDAKPKHRRKPRGATGEDGSGGDLGDRDMPDRGRGQGPPAMCGWDDKTLVVLGGDPGDESPPYEERYSVSDDRQRLIEVVSFKGGRSGGFTMSRTWDRVTP